MAFSKGIAQDAWGKADCALKRRVLVLGSFGYKRNQLDGQTIKTRQVYRLLKERYEGEAGYFCTQTLRDNPFKLLVLLAKILRCGTVITIYASSGGFQTIVPVVFRLTRLLKKRMLYVAIGSTQVDCMEGTGLYTKRRDNLLKACRRLEGFLAETKKIRDVLVQKYQFKNVDLFPNFRYFDEDIAFSPASRSTLRLVFMARITPAKGYDVAFKFFESIKGKGYDITLDFYGPMDGVCNDEFLASVDRFEDQGVRYRGVLQQQDIYFTLRQYDVLVFPTQIDGIPGSIIDAYIASLAIVATNWEYAHEIIDDGENGFIVAYDNPRKQEEFNEAIMKLYHDRDLLNRMKRCAYESRCRYSAQTAWSVLEKYL